MFPITLNLSFYTKPLSHWKSIFLNFQRKPLSPLQNSSPPPTSHQITFHQSLSKSSLRNTLQHSTSMISPTLHQSSTPLQAMPNYTLPSIHSSYYLYIVALSSLKEYDLLIAADTIVSFEGCVFEKPKDADDARTTLESLSGKSHDVFTAVVMFIKNSGYKVVPVLYIEGWRNPGRVYM